MPAKKSPKRVASASASRGKGARTKSASARPSAALSKGKRRAPPSRKRTARASAAPKKSKPTTKRTTRRKPQDGIGMLVKEHRAVKTMFARYKRLGDRAYKSKQNLVGMMIRELSIHAAIEEQLLYPMVRMSVRNGDKLTEEALREHRETKEILADLEKMDPTDDGYDIRVKALIKDVEHHVREEEREMFPRFRKEIEREKLVEMAEQLRMLRKIAPTRPHPRAPQTPPANMLTGLLASIVDRARDARERRSA